MNPGRIALIYGAVGAFWILVSDLFAFRSGYLPGAVKGVAFVIVTGLLLYMLLKRYQRDLNRERLGALANAARYQTLVEHAPVGLFVQSEGVFRYLNPEAARLFGGNRTSDLTGTAVLDRFDPVFHSEVQQCLDEVRQDSHATLNVTCVSSDGHQFDAEMTAVAMEHDGEPAALVYLADVSERAGRERLFRAIAESLPAKVWIADENGAFTYLNEGWYTFTGLPREESTLQRWAEVVHPGDVASVLEAWRISVETKTPYEVRLRYRRYDGEYVWYLARALPIVASERRVVNWFGISTDVDDSVRLLAGLEAAAEAERVRLARELHDDLGQLLAAAKLNIELALLTGKDVEARLTNARDELQRCMQRTRNMAVMMRPAVLEHGGLVAALRSQARDFESASGIACEFVSNVETVELSYTASLAMYRIVQEALTNAAKHSRATRVKVELWLLPKAVRTAVSDDGRGFDIRKDRSGGLGLIGMRERARATNSSLTVESNETGTRIQMDVPLAAIGGAASAP